MTITMLVVEDEEADIIRFKRAARKAKVTRTIEVCRSGPDALKLLASQTKQSASEPNYLLVSDLKMPVMRGTELVERVRRELGLSYLPAFILSSSDSSGDIEEALAKGANGYISKCESEAEYLNIVKWLEDCCCRIEQGSGFVDDKHSDATLPPQIIVAAPAKATISWQPHSSPGSVLVGCEAASGR